MLAGMNNTDMNGLDAGSLNMGSLNMTSIVVSTITSLTTCSRLAPRACRTAVSFARPLARMD